MSVDGWICSASLLLLTWLDKCESTVTVLLSRIYLLLSKGSRRRDECVCAIQIFFCSVSSFVGAGGLEGESGNPEIAIHAGFPSPEPDDDKYIYKVCQSTRLNGTRNMYDLYII